MNFQGKNVLLVLQLARFSVLLRLCISVPSSIHVEFKEFACSFAVCSHKAFIWTKPNVCAGEQLMAYPTCFMRFHLKLAFIAIHFSMSGAQ
jgi:hypothetical protein